MLQKLSSLIKTLKIIGYGDQSFLIVALASLSIPDTDKILKEIKNTFDLDDAKAAKISRYLALKNLSLTDSSDESSKNEAASADKMSETFLKNNNSLKKELEEAKRLWEAWGSWSESSSSNYKTPAAESDFYNNDLFSGDQSGIHPDLRDAKTGMKFSDPKVSLMSQPRDFYYLSPIDENGNLMSVDEFFSYYIKKGIVPILSTQVGSVFFENFLNTAEDIYDMDEVAVNEFIGLMKLEDSMHTMHGGESKIFNSFNVNEDVNSYEYNQNYNQMNEDELWENRKIRRHELAVKNEQDNLRSLVGEIKKLLITEREQGRLSGGVSGSELSQGQSTSVAAVDKSEDIRKIISYVFGISNEEVKTNLSESDEVYKLIYSDFSGFYTLFNMNKEEWKAIAEYIAKNNPHLFIGLRLYRIYKPEEYTFSEECLEKTTKRLPLLRSNKTGLDLFYLAKLWKELPEHFIELAADEDPKRFFESEIFKSGIASDRAIGIASKAYLGSVGGALYWFNLGISSKVPKNHFDSAVRLLAEEDPARFLAWTSKDGKRLSDFYPEEKETAEERFLDIAKDLPHEDPIVFFSPPFPGGKKLWADYYAANNIGTMEEGISIAIETAKSFIQKEGHTKEGMIFSANWMKAGLSDFPRLDEVTRLAVNILIKNLQSFVIEYGYDTSLDGAEDLNDLKEYFNKAIKNPSKVRFRDYDDKANIPVITAKIKEYLETLDNETKTRR